MLHTLLHKRSRWVVQALLVLLTITRGYSQGCTNSTCCDNVSYTLGIAGISYSGNTASVTFTSAVGTTTCVGDKYFVAYTATYDFGDGSPVTGTVTAPTFSVTHTYTMSGICTSMIYTVSTCVGNDGGYMLCNKTQTILIGSPSTYYTINASYSGCKVVTLNYTGTVPLNNAQWNFGDGTTSSVITNTASTSITHTYAAGGSYVVSLGGQGISGCPVTYAINIPDFVVPDFTYTVNGQCTSTPTVAISVLNYTSAYTYSAYVNGVQSSLSGASGSFTNNLHPGINTVQLLISNGAGCTTAVTKTVSIGSTAFTITATNTSCKTFSFSYSGSWPVNNAQWAFGDGSLSPVITNTANNTAVHTYPNAGTYVVSLTGIGISPCQVTTTITVADFESADFSYTVNNVCDPAGGITLAIPSYTNNTYTYSWKINNMIVPYAGNPGNYTTNLQQGQNVIKFTITNGPGCETSVTKYVNIGSPAASFGALTSVCVNDPLSIFNVGAGGDTYTWDIKKPDNSSVPSITGMNPIYTFTTAGTYTVKLTVTTTYDLTVCTNTFATNITVSSMPDASFTVSPVCNGSMSLTVPTNTTGAYALNYGDGTSPYTGTGSITVAQLSHTYTTNGSYVITLTRTNGACVNTYTQNITITNPALSINASSQYLCPGSQVVLNPVLSFVPQTAGTLSYSWTGANAFTSTQQVVSVATGGTFQVTVTSGGSCPVNVTATKSITALASPTAAIVQTGSISCASTTGTASIQLAVDLVKQGYCINGVCTAGNPGATVPQTVVVSGLIGGSNYVTIANGLSQSCNSNLLINMVQANPTLSVTVTQPTSCGANSGAATAIVTPAGGTTSWYTQENFPATSFATGLSVSSLSVGSYVVKVVNGFCVSQYNFSIVEPVINLSKSGGIATCAGNTTTVSLLAQFSPTMTTTYNFSVQQIGGSLIGSGTGTTYSVAPGNYSITVTSNGCVSSQTFHVNQYSPLTISCDPTPQTCINPGNVSAIVSGGDGNYNYKWYVNSVLNTTNNTSYLGMPPVVAATSISLSVTDQSGCSNTCGPVTIAPPTPVTLLNCGGTGNTNATNVTPCGISACVQGGTGPYKFEWYKVAGTKTLVQWDFFYSGGQFIAVAGQQTVVVAVPANSLSLNLGNNTDSLLTTVSYPYWDFSGANPIPVMNAAGLATNTGTNTNPGYYYNVAETVTLSSQPGLVGSYTGGSGAVGETTGFTTGNYSLSVTDANGCVYTFSIGPLVFTKPTTFNISFEYVWGMGPKTVTVEPVDVVLNEDMIEAAADLLNQASKCMQEKTKTLNNYLTNTCFDLSNFKDAFNLEYDLSEHHHTLYYYDRAGRLTKTVPPQGVGYLNQTDINSIKANRAATGAVSFTTVTHRMATTYQYNSFGQLISQATPDGGATNFIYDSKNRLRFSQNDRQKNAGTPVFSYTNYDDLGRIVEVGENSDNSLNFASLGAAVNLTSADNSAYPPSGTKKQVTHTAYSDQSQVTYYGKPQRYLQNRVSYTWLDPDPTITNDESYTYYSYDSHGNVEWLVQDYPGGIGKNYIAYQYDLVSGKVLQVSYNEKRLDRFYHRYVYDSENRLVKTQSSVNGEIWDEDADYKYYAHGPLKRQVIGEDHVQGLDYIYTIHGWIKSINSPTLTTASDPGGDNNTGFTPASGNYQERVAADRNGMVLNYYNGDYTRSGNFLASVTAKYALASYSTTSAPSLYNGNISSWVQSQLNTTSTDPIIPRSDLYQYDLLNRIRKSTSLQASTSAASGWEDINTGNDHTFNTNYTYDANGNILSLARYENNGNKMDSLQYTYDNGAQAAAKNSNRLVRVRDLSSSFLNGRGDFEDSTRYTYDDIGNITKEIGKERVNISGAGIALCTVTTSIEWTVYGKIQKVSKTFVDPANSSFVHKETLNFVYDAAGNRVKKEYWKDMQPTHDGTVQPQEITTTYYVRDAQGNTMATYKRFFDISDSKFKFQLIEQPIYGSDRLGMSTRKVTLASSATFTSLVMPVNGAAAISEYQNWITSTNKGQLLPNGLVNDNLCQCRIMSLQNSTLNPNYSNVQTVVEFLGIANNGVAIAEDLNSNMQFYVVVAKNYLGNANACLVFDKNGKLMKGTENIGSTDPSSKPVVVNIDGTNSYAVITLDNNKQPMYHIVDMNQAGYGPVGNTGEVIAYNQSLVTYAGTPPQHGYHFTGMEDHITGHSVIYSSRYTVDPLDATKGTTDIMAYDFGTGTITPQANLVYSTYGCGSTEVGELQISPGGDKLAWYQHDQNLAGFNIRTGSIHILPLSTNKLAINGTPTVQPISTAGNSGNGMLEFMKDDKNILYAQRGVYKEGPGATKYDRNIWQYDPVNLTTLAANPNASNPAISYLLGEIKRGKDGNYYIPNMGKKMDKIHSYTGSAWNGNVSVNDTTYQMSSSLPTQVYKIFADPSQNVTDFIRDIGQKEYELKDHLGNVKVVISDAKLVADADVSGSITSSDLFTPEVLNYQDYYAFGEMLPGRKYQVNTEDYRYGFNSKEKDDEINGSSNSLDFGARIQDPRTGRWLSIDPRFKLYPQLSPYSFAANNPLIFIDEDGKVITFVNAKGEADDRAKNFYDLYYKTASPELKAKLDILQSSEVVYNVTFEAFSEADAGYGGYSTYNWDNGHYEAKINTNHAENLQFGSMADELEGAYQYETGEMAAFSLHGQPGWLFYDANDELKTKEAAFEARQKYAIMADIMEMISGIPISMGEIPEEYQRLNDLYNNYKSGALTEEQYLKGYDSWLTETEIGRDYSKQFPVAEGNQFPTKKDWDTKAADKAKTRYQGAGQKVRYRETDENGNKKTTTLTTPD